MLPALPLNPAFPQRTCCARRLGWAERSDAVQFAKPKHTKNRTLEASPYPTAKHWRFAFPRLCRGACLQSTWKVADHRSNAKYLCADPSRSCGSHPETNPLFPGRDTGLSPVWPWPANFPMVDDHGCRIVNVMSLCGRNGSSGQRLMSSQGRCASPGQVGHASGRRQNSAVFCSIPGICKKSTTRRLTLRRGKSYNHSTEEMVLTGAVDSSSPPDAIGTWQPVPLKGTGTPRRLSRGLLGPLVLPLFDIVEERKRNAGGVCPGGSSESTGKRNTGRSRFEKPKLRSLPANIGCRHVCYSSMCAATRFRWQLRIASTVFQT